MKRFRNAMTPMNVEFFLHKTEDEIASLQAEILRQTTWGRELLKRHDGKSTT